MRRLGCRSPSAEARRSSLTPGRGGRAHQRQPHLLHQLLEQQHYRLAYWRPANDEINYRRFFGINELIAIHAENAEVFARSHELSWKLALRTSWTACVSITWTACSIRSPICSSCDPRSNPHRRNPWLVVEKVLDPSERLGAHWPVDGTTGYDALDALNRLFVSGRGVRILRRFFQRLVDETSRFERRRIAASD